MTTTVSAPLSAPGDGAAPALTPTLRALGARALFWIVAAVAALVVALIAMLSSAGGVTASPPLSAGSATPDGGMAVAEVLRGQGVEVVVADSLDAALAATAAADAGAGATLLVSDFDGILSDEQIGRLDGAAAHTVVVDPHFALLNVLAPEVGFGGLSEPDAAVPAGADCTIPAALRADELGGAAGTGLKSLRVPAETPGTTGCFGSPGAGATSALVQLDGPGGRLSLVADPAVFANGSVAEAGNAALALGLLGETPTLVWYLPTLADVADAAPPSLAELSPGWLTPAIVLLVLCGVAAAIVHGRRFGPLVVENLPVTVRASETMEGRARLYARHSARLRAVDALRMATIGRLAGRLGLSRTASVDEVALSAADATGTAAAAVRAVLLDEVPGSDAAMLTLSERLLDLERAVETATRPGERHHGAQNTTAANERMDP